MLSTAYRLRLESICRCIANNEEVPLEDMIWAEKLAKAHTLARDWLNKARRQASQDIQEGSMDDFMNKMGLGDPTHLITKRGLMVPMKSLIGFNVINPMIGGNVTEKITPQTYEKMNEEFIEEGLSFRIIVPTQEQIDDWIERSRNVD